MSGNHPWPLKLEKGTSYSWCTCGHSASEPFCDGSHRTLCPDKKSLKFSSIEDQKIALCGCKKTNTPPYCDGSHTNPTNK